MTAFHDAETTSIPQFKHSCPTCKFLGRYHRVLSAHLPDGDFDLYVCPQGSVPTVLARYGNDAPEYLSGLPEALSEMTEQKNPTWPLVVALQRAIYEGYLKITWTEKK